MAIFTSGCLVGSGRLLSLWMALIELTFLRMVALLGPVPIRLTMNSATVVGDAGRASRSRFSH